jgi:glutamate synthase (NADPH/NADH) small chain
MFEGDMGVVTAAHFDRVAWKTDPVSKKFGPVKVDGSAFTLKVDLVLLAMGFVHVEHEKFLEEMGITFDSRGNIACKSNYATSSDGVFVAGDAGSGASLVVRAIFHGREAARSVDEYLTANK